MCASPLQSDDTCREAKNQVTALYEARLIGGSWPLDYGCKFLRCFTVFSSFCIQKACKLGAAQFPECEPRHGGRGPHSWTP